MSVVRLSLRLWALICALVFAAYLFACAANAQQLTERRLQPDMHRAHTSRAVGAPPKGTTTPRPHGYWPQRDRAALPLRPPYDHATSGDQQPPAAPLTTARNRPRPQPRAARPDPQPASAPAFISTRIAPGTPLRRVLHTAQLDNNSSAGTDEQFTDATGDFVADQRATFDTRGGSFDLAVGRTGTRYEVFTALDDRGTANPNDDIAIGVLVTARDTDGDFARDTAATYDLYRDFNLPSATAVVAGTSRAGREFVCVSSSGYYNFSNPNDPDNEASPGVVLLVRDPVTGGFDNARSRTLVAVGSNQLSNANALALMPNGDLLVADFDADELRVVRDRDGDGLPDTLDPAPFYQFQFANDAPLDIAVNARGVVFSHSVGPDTVLLAIYDTNNDGYADTDEVAVVGLSIDDNLILHGLSVDREGTIYIIEDATGAADVPAAGGNGGVPLIDACPDPALDGFPRAVVLYVSADNPTAQTLTGLAFGQDATLAPVAHLTLTNSASLSGRATNGGLGTILGSGLTLGRSGRTAAEATARGVRVTIAGASVPVHSFADGQLHIYVPAAASTSTTSTVVVTVDGTVTAADEVQLAPAQPGLFTTTGTGAGEVVALLVSGGRYAPGPFPVRVDNQPAVVALFGTGWRNSLPVSVTVGGRAGVVEYAGPAGGFPGLDQLNLRLPDGLVGPVAVVVRTANGASSRSAVTLSIR